MMSLRVSQIYTWMTYRSLLATSTVERVHLVLYTRFHRFEEALYLNKVDRSDLK